MADKYLIQKQTLDDIANAINAKTGETEKMTPLEMVDKIESITPAKEEQSKTLTLGASAPATVLPDSDKVLSSVPVVLDTNVIKAENIAKDVTMLGVTGTHEGGGIPELPPIIEWSENTFYMDKDYQISNEYTLPDGYIIDVISDSILTINTDAKLINNGYIKAHCYRFKIINNGYIINNNTIIVELSSGSFEIINNGKIDGGEIKGFSSIINNSTLSINETSSCVTFENYGITIVSNALRSCQNVNNYGLIINNGDLSDNYNITNSNLIVNNGGISSNHDIDNSNGTIDNNKNNTNAFIRCNGYIDEGTINNFYNGTIDDTMEFLNWQL